MAEDAGTRKLTKAAMLVTIMRSLRCLGESQASVPSIRASLRAVGQTIDERWAQHYHPMWAAVREGWFAFN